METNPLTVQITPSVSAGTGCGRNRPRADAWGYLAALPFEAALPSTTETDLVGATGKEAARKAAAAKIGCPTSYRRPSHLSPSRHKRGAPVLALGLNWV